MFQNPKIFWINPYLGDKADLVGRTGRGWVLEPPHICGGATELEPPLSHYYRMCEFGIIYNTVLVSLAKVKDLMICKYSRGKSMIMMTKVDSSNTFR